MIWARKTERAPRKERIRARDCRRSPFDRQAYMRPNGSLHHVTQLDDGVKLHVRDTSNRVHLTIYENDVRRIFQIRAGRQKWEEQQWHACCTSSEIDRPWHPLEVKKTEGSEHDIVCWKDQVNHSTKQIWWKTWMSPTMLLQVSRSPAFLRTLSCGALREKHVCPASSLVYWSTYLSSLHHHHLHCVATCNLNVSSCEG